MGAILVLPEYFSIKQLFDCHSHVDTQQGKFEPEWLSLDRITSNGGRGLTIGSVGQP